MIHLDHSQSSGILITCTECPYWFSFRFEKDEARRSGEDHQQRVHGISQEVAAQARRAADYRMRHAANS